MYSIAAASARSTVRCAPAHFSMPSRRQMRLRIVLHATQLATCAQQRCSTFAARSSEHRKLKRKTKTSGSRAGQAASGTSALEASASPSARLCWRSAAGGTHRPMPRWRLASSQGRW